MATNTPAPIAAAPALAGSEPGATFDPTGTYEPTFTGETYVPSRAIETPAYSPNQATPSMVDENAPAIAPGVSPAILHMTGPDELTPSLGLLAASAPTKPVVRDVGDGALAAIIIGIVLGIGLGLYIMHRSRSGIQTSGRETSWNTTSSSVHDHNDAADAPGMWNLQRDRRLS